MNNLDVTTNLAELEHGQVIFKDRFDADFCIEILHEGNERQEPADSQLSPCWLKVIYFLYLLICRH